MATGTLTIDLDALVANWRALDAASAVGVETAAVVKADGYGLGAGRVAQALARAGARLFFVAVAEEGATLREALGPNPDILVLGGHMRGDSDMLRDLGLTPILNSIDQMTRHFEALPGHPFGVQLDTGMNRLGLEPRDWEAVRDIVLAQNPVLLMSHLACADEPDHAMNTRQLTVFHAMTDGLNVPRSLAATAGILLGPAYHFELTRPGIGLYGGAPFQEARPVVGLRLPLVQTRVIEAGEYVGYGNAWRAQTPATIATLAAGYADGVMRAIAAAPIALFDGPHEGATACPLVGRVSMDLLSVDITALRDPVTALDILTPNQTIDDLAGAAGTIGYEILTAFGARYQRRYLGGHGA